MPDDSTQGNQNMFTIAIRLGNGATHEFNDIQDAFAWAHTNDYTISPNGWEELNEYCERMPLYAEGDSDDAPSAELLVQCEIDGAAHHYCDSHDENGEPEGEFMTMATKRDVLQWIEQSMGDEGSTELAAKVWQYLYDTDVLPNYGENWSNYLKTLNPWQIIAHLEDYAKEEAAKNS